MRNAVYSERCGFCNRGRVSPFRITRTLQYTFHDWTANLRGHRTRSVYVGYGWNTSQQASIPGLMSALRVLWIERRPGTDKGYRVCPVHVDT